MEKFILVFALVFGSFSWSGKSVAVQPGDDLFVSADGLTPAERQIQRETREVASSIAQLRERGANLLADHYDAVLEQITQQARTSPVRALLPEEIAQLHGVQVQLLDALTLYRWLQRFLRPSDSTAQFAQFLDAESPALLRAYLLTVPVKNHADALLRAEQLGTEYARIQALRTPSSRKLKQTLREMIALQARYALTLPELEYPEQHLELAKMYRTLFVRSGVTKGALFGGMIMGVANARADLQVALLATVTGGVAGAVLGGWAGLTAANKMITPTEGMRLSLLAQREVVQAFSKSAGIDDCVAALRRAD